MALPISRDHKRLGDGDIGPNTGGMGAVSPLADLPDDEAEAILDRFHRPVLAELARRGTPFRGALYAGLMLTADGPRLLEFNARFGDPETQAMLPRLAAPLGPLLLAAAQGRLDERRPIPTLPGATTGDRPRRCRLPGRSGRPGADRRARWGARPRGDDLPRRDPRHARRRLGNRRGSRARPSSGADRIRPRRAWPRRRAADAISWPGLQRRHDIGLAGEPAAAAVGAAP